VIEAVLSIAVPAGVPIGAAQTELVVAANTATLINVLIEVFILIFS